MLINRLPYNRKECSSDTVVPFRSSLSRWLDACGEPVFFGKVALDEMPVATMPPLRGF
jgi:hypothetical protein